MSDQHIDRKTEETARLDLGKLVGFSVVMGADLDFRDPTFAARIGAKTGTDPQPEDTGVFPAGE